MEVQVWRSFSCNNSGGYYLVAEFGSPAEASAVAGDVEAFLKIHAVQKDATEDWEAPSAIQIEIEQKYGISFKGEYLDWGGGGGMVGDEPTVGVAGTKVVFAHGYCGGLGFLEPLLEARGALETTHEHGDPILATMFTVTDSASGKRVLEELTTFFGQPSNDLSDWKPGPWKGAARRLPYADVSEEVLWWSDGASGGFHMPFEPADLGPIKSYLEGPGFEDFRLLVCDNSLQAKLRVLSQLGNCPECKSANIKYLAADASMPEDQMVCDGCGGMFSLSTMQMHAPVISVCSARLSCPRAVGDAIFAVSFDGSVYKRAKKWRKLSAGKQRLLSLYTRDGKLIATCGFKALRVSADSGKTWKDKKTGLPGWVFSVEASPDGTLFVGAAGGLILRSASAGKKWETLATPTKKDVLHVSAASDQVLYACTRDARILRSKNGGQTWKASKVLGKTPLCRVIASSETSAVVVGDKGLILSTSDGATWTRRPSGVSGDIEDVIIGNDGRYYAIESGGTVLASKTGTRWTRHPSGARAHMWGLCATPSGRLICVGDAGTVARVDGLDSPAAVKAAAPPKANAKAKAKAKAKTKAKTPKNVTVGKSFAFTGKLENMSRAEAKARVKALGGASKSSVTKDLAYLVIGDDGSPLFGRGAKGSKMIAAEELIAAGADLEIISETVFLKMKMK